MTHWCLIPGCNVLIVGHVGESPNRCAEHATTKAKTETDEQRIARVCAEMGWRRVSVNR